MKNKFTFTALVLGLFSLNSCVKNQPGNNTQLAGVNVAVFAGTGIASYLDGASSGATFSGPGSVAVDAAGNVYVADIGNNVIRVISNFSVSTFAGTGKAGYIDGQAFLSGFNKPSGLVIDGSGNLFIADAGNNVIRKITLTGSAKVTTYAGTGTSGHSDGAATSATFNAPTALAVDASGNLYVSDSGNNLIRKITTTGVVSTYAGTGTAGYIDAANLSATFNAPAGLTVDKQGNLYVADAGNNVIREINVTGTVSTYAGSTAGYQDGAGTTARFSGPKGLTIDLLGNLYVGDTFNNNIRRITTAKVVSTYAGSGIAGLSDGTSASATFNQPEGIAFDSIGNLYVADFFNNVIRIVSGN